MEIKELKIYTQNLLQQVDFYSKKLGLALIDKTENQATFQIGKSKFRIVKSDKSQPYHFAINIPNNKEIESLAWLNNRVEILKDGENEIQYFDGWNAKAIYFYDIDNNIVEFIARKNLKNESHADFDVDSLLEISEIGMPVRDIESTFNALKKISSIEIFDGEFNRFCAIGDEYGLFICINKQVKDWFPAGDKANSSAFEIRFREKGSEYEIAFINEQIKAVAKSYKQL